MVEYSKVHVKLSDTQIKKLSINSCQKENRKNSENKVEMFNGNDLSHELLLTTRQKNRTKKCI